MRYIVSLSAALVGGAAALLSGGATGEARLLSAAESRAVLGGQNCNYQDKTTTENCSPTGGATACGNVTSTCAIYSTGKCTKALANRASWWRCGAQTAAPWKNCTETDGAPCMDLYEGDPDEDGDCPDDTYCPKAPHNCGSEIITPNVAACPPGTPDPPKPIEEVKEL